MARIASRWTFQGDLLLISILLASISLAGQASSSPAGTMVAANEAVAPSGWTPPRTADGQPDLQGIWTNTTMTPFERPGDLGSKQFFSEKEAADYEKALREGKIKTPRETAEDDVVGAYDRETWSESANHIVSSRRTSLV